MVKPVKRLTTQGKAVSPAAKQAVLDDAKQMIPHGASVASIAKKHGIAERTLEYWLSSLGDEYIELRKLWIDNLLGEAGELLKDRREDGHAALRLARARELWKRATWYAERRDRARYGQDAPPQGVNAVQININLRRSADGTAQDAAQVIDVKANGD
jgi:transposase-like protein